MMYSEFTERTGIYPTMDLYREIEEAYYDFPGNKDEFCKAYKENKDGLAEKIAYRANDNADAKLKAKEVKARELEAQIKKLEAALEREQEWKTYTNERAYSQSAYDHLRTSGHEMSDEEAKHWIADEFGFAEEKIRINRKMNAYEINRHGQLRKAGEIDRTPYYDATDWYYIFFTVCGMDYEAHDGTFRSI